MTYLRPSFRHPEQPINELGFTRKDYEGALSTLCAGCGHDSIGAAIVQACFELSIAPHKVAKLSGIGCSSKTPTYFLGNSHGFNSVHGRMPSVATGASSGPVSSSGFFSSSPATKASSSRLDSASSLIACCNCGVMTRDWLWRMSRRGPSAIRRAPGRGGKAAPAPCYSWKFSPRYRRRTSVLATSSVGLPANST